MNTLKRELKVAFSKHAQPLWLRLLKWTMFVGVAVLLYRTGYFWSWIAGLPALGVVVHFLYRWKTKGWTRSWGGWRDVEAGKS
jgi:hypothetical protein